MRRVVKLAAVAAVVLGASSFGLAPARSSTVLRFGNRQLTERAEVVVHGRCVEKRAAFTADDRIYTEYRFAVDEVIKGEVGTTIHTFRQWGGVVGDRGMLIAGAASFDIGEEVVVFCDAPDDVHGLAFTIGLAQGKYTVSQDRATGERWVHRDLAGLNILDEVDRATGRQLFPAARTQHHREPRRTLRSLLQEVRGYIR